MVRNRQSDYDLEGQPAAVAVDQQQGIGAILDELGETRAELLRAAVSAGEAVVPDPIQVDAVAAYSHGEVAKCYRQQPGPSAGHDAIAALAKLALNSET
jgi:hypothetical protein